MQTTPKKFIFFISVFCSLLFIGAAIPLTTGAVEPNNYYGIRIDKAYESGEMWYEVNRYGGRALIIASIVMLVANSLLFAARKKFNNLWYILLFLLIFMGCILTAAFITDAYVNTL